MMLQHPHSVAVIVLVTCNKCVSHTPLPAESMSCEINHYQNRDLIQGSTQNCLQLMQELQTYAMMAK